MVDFQLVLAAIPDVVNEPLVDFAVTLESLDGPAGRAVDRLEVVWEAVSQRLSKVMNNTKAFLESPYDLDTIEFNIGIEAGVAVGLVTKGDASITVTFKRSTGEAPPS